MSVDSKCVLCCVLASILTVLVMNALNAKKQKTTMMRMLGGARSLNMLKKEGYLNEGDETRDPSQSM